MYKHGHSFDTTYHNFMLSDGRTKVITFRETDAGLVVDCSTTIPSRNFMEYLEVYAQAYQFVLEKTSSAAFYTRSID